MAPALPARHLSRPDPREEVETEELTPIQQLDKSASHAAIRELRADQKAIRELLGNAPDVLLKVEGKGVLGGMHTMSGAMEALAGTVKSDLDSRAKTRVLLVWILKIAAAPIVVGALMLGLKLIRIALEIK